MQFLNRVQPSPYADEAGVGSGLYNTHEVVMWQEVPVLGTQNLL